MKIFRAVVPLFILVGTSSAQETPLTLGVIVPLSGPVAHIGEDVRKGVMLALEETSGVVARFEDNQHDLRQTATVAQKFVRAGDVFALLTLWDPSDVVAPIAERAHIPHVAIRWNPHITEGNRFTFTFETSYRNWVRSQVDLIHKRGFHRIALLRAQSAGWDLGASELKRLIGDELVADEPYLAGTSDFRSLAMRLFAKSPEIVVLYSLYPETGLALRQLKSLRPNVEHTGYYEDERDLTLFEGATFVAQSVAAPEFRERFERRYGEQPVSRAPHAYEVTKIFLEALSHAKKSGTALERGEQMVEWMEQIRDRPSVLGPLSVGGVRNIENVPVWMEIRDGKMERYK